MEIEWHTSFDKSLLLNKQLISSKNGFIAFQNKLNSASIEMLQLKRMAESNHQICLMFCVDIRNHLWQQINKSSTLEICFYFPLTREKYILKGTMDKVSPQTFSPILKDVWQKELTQEDRNEFTKEAPGLQKQTMPEDFQSQDISQVSQNFGILLLQPIKVDRTLIKMPQVIADSRNPKFESEFRPYQKDKRYIYELGQEGKWKITEVNP